MKKEIEPPKFSSNPLETCLDGMYSGVRADISRRAFMKLTLTTLGAIGLAGCQNILPTIVPSPNSTRTPASSEAAPTAIATPVEPPTATNTPEPIKTPTTKETVHIEELNPGLWWLVARDEKGTGTYKRVLDGEYTLVRDENGRIIDAFDADGTQVDAVLFKNGGYYFGWKGVNVEITNGSLLTSVTIGVVNTGIIVESKGVENGVDYDFTSVKILVGVTDTEFQEYLMPFAYIRHDPDLGDQTNSGFLVSITDGGRYLNEVDEIVNLLTYKENVNKQIGIGFEVGQGTLEQIEAYRGEPLPDRGLTMYHIRNDLSRSGLVNKSQWPPAGGVFGYTSEIKTFLNGNP